jgi:hypothetical protein
MATMFFLFGYNFYKIFLENVTIYYIMRRLVLIFDKYLLLGIKMGAKNGRKEIAPTRTRKDST